MKFTDTLGTILECIIGGVTDNVKLNIYPIRFTGCVKLNTLRVTYICVNLNTYPFRVTYCAINIYPTRVTDRAKLTIYPIRIMQ